MAVPLTPLESTTGRLISAARAAGLRALAAAAPGLADALVYDLFGTPRGRFGAPEVPGLPTHTFREGSLAVHAINRPRYPRELARALGYSPAQADRFVSYLSRRVGRPDFDLRKLGPLMRARLLVLHDPADREVPVDDGRELAAAWPSGVFE